MPSKRRPAIVVILFIFLWLLLNIWVPDENIIERKLMSQKNHFIITTSFFYPNSSSFGKNTSALVILVNIDKDIDINNFDIKCIIKKSSGEKTIINADHILPIHDGKTSDCRLHNFRIVCKSVGKLGQDDTVMLAIDRFKPLKISWKMADMTKRTFVVCPGRMFVFDQWHLFLTGMELYRALNVDLVVIYIQSVDIPIYGLMEAYKSDGLVIFRPSLRMPEKVPELGYNPNAETTWNNQLINFHDCLYEFRESAEFIAFPDWDELMVTPRLRPVLSIFRDIVKEEPNVASFIYERMAGSMTKLADMEWHNIFDIWMHHLKFGDSYNHRLPSGKVVVRPKYTDGLQVHSSASWTKGFKEHTVSINQTYLIHARDHDDFKLDKRLEDTNILKRNLKKFITKHNLTNLMARLPKAEIMLQEFNSCLGSGARQWEKIRETVSQNTKSKCYSFDQCYIGKVYHECINVKNNWEMVYISPQLSVSVLQNSEFVKKNTCDF
ncbi:glycosyltransferase family 92 domain-containing protein [Ditylenchus destructor]|uniref:Glycosyltransferase family 92 protein n=1 Tax=Ditylenchus destructor TaxID=166010 RepID=A0AAD4MP84_9BILA|nr:glycosyltransferase family 92 domain-containing protein [Ditylenchus destructor]